MAKENKSILFYSLSAALVHHILKILHSEPKLPIELSMKRYFFLKILEIFFCTYVSREIHFWMIFYVLIHIFKLPWIFSKS